MEPARSTALPEVTILFDARGERPENAVGIGTFWYEPEVWSLGLSPAAKVLYASLCSYLAHGQIHRGDLRGTLKDHPDEAIADAFDELMGLGLLGSVLGGTYPTYEIRSVRSLG